MKPEVKQVNAEKILTLRHDVLRPGKPFSTAQFEGDDLITSYHFAVTLESQVIGCVSLMKKQHTSFNHVNTYQLRGMAVDRKFRGRHIGKQLLDFAECQLRHSDIPFIWCNVRFSAIQFYSKNNYKKNGSVFEIPNVGPHVLMSKKL